MKTFFTLIIFCITATAIAQKSVFDIARSGTLDEIKEMHNKFPDTINKTNESGFSPLVLACYRKNNIVAAYLAKNIKDINGNSQYGTPLMAAVVKKNVEMVRKLLELKANPNLADSNQTTALHYATMFKNYEIIELLIKAKANVNLKDNTDKSPLDYAKSHKEEKLNQLFKI